MSDTKILEIKDGMQASAELPFSFGVNEEPPVPSLASLLVRWLAQHPAENVFQACKDLEHSIHQLEVACIEDETAVPAEMAKVYCFWCRATEAVWRDIGVGQESVDNALRGFFMNEIS